MGAGPRGVGKTTCARILAKKINQLANEVSELLSSLKGDSKVDGELSNRISNLRKKISEINNITND